MPEDEKTRENRLRRKLYRMGYQLMKSRARDPDDLTFGGYQIADVQTNALSAGLGNAERGYALSLEEVEDFITQEEKQSKLISVPAVRKSAATRSNMRLMEAEIILLKHGYTKMPDGSLKAPIRPHS